MVAFAKSHFHEETKGRAGHTAWSLLSSRATSLWLWFPWRDLDERK